MVDDCVSRIRMGSSDVIALVDNNYRKLHCPLVSNSGLSVIWQGPKSESPKLTPELERAAREHGALFKNCRTVIRMRAHIHSDVWDAYSEEAERSTTRRRVDASIYLSSLCEGHITAINKLIQRYRLESYDYFPYEVAPWDVPIWTVEARGRFETLHLLEYLTWDDRPLLGPSGHRLRHLPSSTLQEIDTLTVTPGELELLDALSFMGRGDYTGAVRRACTAIEAVIEEALRTEGGGGSGSAEVTAGGRWAPADAGPGG